jgi:starch-binding outer membrane protein, SusD/RagB family
MKHRILISLLLSLLTISNCTDLEEKYGGNLTQSQASGADATALLNNLNNSLVAAFQNISGVIALSELTTDELIAPTRGIDWSDNGVWRSLHQHGWDGDHPVLTGCFRDLNGVVFAATDFLKFNSTPQKEAAARFYRAWAMYWVLDLFDQVPYRDPGESTLLPARVRRGLAALDYIISEVNAAIANLPDGPASEPSKNAAKAFLMKCYLNRGIYASRQSPAFDIGDMNNVISLADEIINSNRYAFANNYFDNFAPDNGNIGKENIFTQENVGGVFVSTQLLYYMVVPLHFNQKPFGFNGWTTLSDFYDKFETDDLRRGQAYNTGLPNPGNRINMGFLIGQQYDLGSDEPLVDDNKSPLIFTRDVNLIENSASLERTGIRPQKYAIDFQNIPAVNNDWVYLRLPDVLLMKAEAILRGGIATNAGPYGNTALQLVNAIRQHPSRGASPLTSIDLNVLLDERGCELWLECWRRQDLIRFGKFLYTSDTRYLVFAIPNQQLGLNRNLIQNPGY